MLEFFSEVFFSPLISSNKKICPEHVKLHDTSLYLIVDNIFICIFLWWIPPGNYFLIFRILFHTWGYAVAWMTGGLGETWTKENRKLKENKMLLGVCNTSLLCQMYREILRILCQDITHESYFLLPVWLHPWWKMHKVSWFCVFLTCLGQKYVW